jgi:hypothetical protein
MLIYEQMTLRLMQCKCQNASLTPGTLQGAHFAPNIPQAQKLFWTHPMELLGDVGHVESRFGPFGNSVSVGAR